MAKPYVEVTFDDKTKKLKYNFNAIADLEEYFGKGVGAVFKEEHIGFNTVRVLYWAGLKSFDKGITVQRTGQMLQRKVEEEYDGNMQEALEDLMNPIYDALEKAGLMKFKSDDEDEDEEKN